MRHSINLSEWRDINMEQRLLDESVATEFTKHIETLDEHTTTELNIGNTITIAEIVWRKFGEDEDGNSYMLADNSVFSCHFGKTNNWKDSPIRERLGGLAERIKKEIGDRIIPTKVNLISHDGFDDYGACEDMVSILTYDLYRNNRRNIKLIDSPWWLATSETTIGESFVPRHNSINNTNYYENCTGEAPASSLQVAVGGRVEYMWVNINHSVRPFFVLKSISD